MIDEAGLETWRRFLEAHAAVVGAIERDLAEEGKIPLEWYDVLIAISEGPQRTLRLRELGRRLLLTRSGATRLADKLEAAGLVGRRPAPDDRRGVILALTEEGRKALRAAWPVYARGIRQRFLARLRGEEAVALSAAMARIASPEGQADPPI